MVEFIPHESTSIGPRAIPSAHTASRLRASGVILTMWNMGALDDVAKAAENALNSLFLGRRYSSDDRNMRLDM